MSKDTENPKALLKRELTNQPRNAISALNSKGDKFYLVVEGTTDVDFYKQYVEEKFRPYVMTPNNVPKKVLDTEFEKNCKNNVYKALKLSMGMGKKNFYGIVDKDYDFDEQKEMSGLKIKDYKNLFRTDAHDLETTIIKYDLEQIEKAIKDKYKINDQNFSYLKTAGNFSYKIGVLRYYDDIKDSQLSINDRQNDYPNYLILKEGSEIDKIEFDDKKYEEEVITKTKKNNQNISIKNIEKDIEELKNNVKEEDIWNYCQGHDVVLMLACILKKENIECDKDDLENLVTKRKPKTFCNSYLYKNLLVAGIAEKTVLFP